ncbi:uncharacterized protein CG7065 isoform X1 [Nomia melanderi]|uniref:uncharacterized protein CG7065 isoform X1 n=1 Tax=Nomia melanderi TaxID=2448451 RepID=UPI0013042137|nr:uncharacterized protein CG7065-like isoform X1 [Nomia melanderi]XP_031836235.1 uncharacterized protein CG7065-like isoform X1 [Nomia melanderi]
MQNFDDLDIEGRNPSHLSEAGKEKEEYDRKRLMRSSVTAEDGTLRPVYSETEDGDIWCHICNIALFGAHKLLNHNMCNRHKMKLDEWPYPVLLWSKRSDIVKTVPPAQSAAIGDGLAPGEPVPPGMEDQITRTTTIQMSLDRHRSSPLVGLEYLLELVDNDSCEPSYTCVLCDKRGDPRTVMAHITSYNHRITYLNRHFPTISRAITELPRTPNYKRGANEISVLVAKKIEERFGRLQPQLVDKNQFEKNKMQYIKRVYQDYHFRETPELTFMDVYDVRWVTNFEEKMAEVAGNSGPKKDSQPADEKLDDKHKSEDKKHEKSPPKKTDSKSDTTKSGFKIRIFTRDKLSIRKPLDKEEENVRKSPKRPSDETKSLSSLSSISSSPSPSRSRSRSPIRNRKTSSMDKGGRYRTKSRYSRDRTRSRTRSRSRSRSPEPLRERDKWDKYRDQIRRAEETLDRALKFHEKNPEKHPSYPDEWKKFWNRRYKELQAEGKDPSKHDFKPEWIEFWNKRMREIHNEQLQQRKEEIRKRLELPEDKPPEKWIPSNRRDRSPPKRSRHRIESDDEVEYVGTKTVKTDYYDHHDLRDRDYAYSSYVRGRGNTYRSSYYPRGVTRPRSIHYATPYPVKEKSPSPIPDDILTEDLEVVGLLRLLTALEGQLGSLGPKIVSLLSKALAAEKAKPNSAEELLYDEEVSVLFETVKEKLKGQLFAGMIEKMAITPTKTAIQNIAQLLHKATESKKKMEEEKKKKREMETAKSANYIQRTVYTRPVEVITPTIKSEPVSVPGVGTVDKVAIAQQIAAALVAQGRSNVSQEELETLINAVVGMAEASKNSDKPVTTADFVKGLARGNTSLPQTTSAPATLTTADTIDHQTSKMESLSDADLKALLQNFKDLSSQEQHGLINFLKKLEVTDPVRVEKLRAFVNLGSTSIVSSMPKIKSPTPENIETNIKSNRSISPFSVRKGNQNPVEEEDKWKPKIDMFANDDEEEQQTKNDNEDKQKAKLDLSDDDDDYTFEDIYKAADKNVSENEKAKKKSRGFSKSVSNSPKSWTRSRSRSRSRSPVRPKELTKTNDPNAILNETKRLIAHIMGDLPNKYVPKSHLSLGNENAEQNTSKPLDQIPNTSTAPLSNFYNQGYVQNTQQTCTRPQAPPLSYPSMSNQQFQNYPHQQVYSGNQNYVDNGYNYQGYGAIGNQGQYSGPSMASNQYPNQQNYGGSPYGGLPTNHSSNYSQQPPQQQYGNYVQQQRFY